MNQAKEMKPVPPKEECHEMLKKLLDMLNNTTSPLSGDDMDYFIDLTCFAAAYEALEKIKQRNEKGDPVLAVGNTKAAVDEVIINHILREHFVNNLELGGMSKTQIGHVITYEGETCLKVIEKFLELHLAESLGSLKENANNEATIH